MSTASIRPSPQEVRKRAEEIKRKIEAAFPDVDVLVAGWDDLIGQEGEHWEHLGFQLPRPWIHAYLLIRGDERTTEEAASLADGEVARLLEETDVIIQVQRTYRVRCKQSVPLAAFSPPALKATRQYVKIDGKGITFVCTNDQDHEHDWGRLKPQG